MPMLIQNGETMSRPTKEDGGSLEFSESNYGQHIEKASFLNMHNIYNDHSQ